MENTHFDWNHARAFLATVKAGSLSTAAKSLNLSQPTLSRQISALEQSLKVSLFERSPKGLELTPTGLQLYEHVAAMESAATQFSLTAQGHSKTLEGSICISATEALSAFVLPSIIRKLRQQYPGIDIELIATNETSDLKRREADIAIRAFRPTQESLIIKKVADCKGRLYATPQYIQSIGPPKAYSELSDAQFISFDRSEEAINALAKLGINLSPENFPIIVENHLVHWELTKQGIGIGLMTEDIGDGEIMVERVIPDGQAFEFELWLVAHKELKTSLRVRTVYDFLYSELKQYFKKSEC